jgi:uncharacterized RDD family membrane protein YckC
MTEQQMLSSDTSDSSQPSDEIWRDEIQARVARYRTRRGRRIEGTYSMRFPFGAEEEAAKAAQPESSEDEPEPQITAPRPNFLENIEPAADSVPVIDLSVSTANEATAPEIVPSPSVTVENLPEEPAATESVRDADSDLVLEADPEPLPLPVARPAAKRKVIAFPRPASAPEEVYHRLADPVIPEQPRILDVPEELEPFPTTPLLEGLQLSAQQNVNTPPRDHIDLPSQTVSLPRRFSAGLIDCGVVAAASAVFGAIAYKLMPKIEPSKPLVLTLAVLPFLFWAVYQYMLMMYAGATLGMQLTKIHLSTFKGGAPNWRHRRSRVISLFFSAASMGMGLLWSLVDVDALCWHDRISHTYLTRRN